MSFVSTEKWNALNARLASLGIDEKDLHERFIRASGPGGQNVNKTSTCVALTHLPSAITVRCQEERTQGLNRYRARKLLADKVEEMRLGAESRRQKEIAKIRRQKKVRSRRAKEKMLVEKHQRSEIKQARKGVVMGDEQ
jgi:protein subunit release factor B